MIHLSDVAPQSTQRSAFPTGAVAGGVAGGLIFLLLCFLVYTWKRRRSETTFDTQHEIYTGETAYHAVNPYIVTTSPPPYSSTAEPASENAPQMTRKSPTVNTGTFVPVCAFLVCDFNNY